MTKIDHSRPILRLIDEIRRQRVETRIPRARKWEPPATIKSPGSVANFEASLVNARGSAMNAIIHRAAYSVLVHVAKYSDIRLVDRLIAAVPDSVRRSRLRTWFTVFGPVEFAEGKAKYRRETKTRLGAATTKPFWNFKAEE